ncbi:MAG: transcription termination factor Rho [Phycisphaerales bacterium]|nr:transcription termination factor Rho [Phycisphaerales bacterium]
MTTFTGILEWPQRGDGRLRQLNGMLLERPDDPIVPFVLGERFPLRAAQELTVEVSMRKPRRRRGRNRGPNAPPRTARPIVERILAIDGLEPDSYSKRLAFEQLTSIDPQPRLTLEYPGCPPANRLIDLFCPIGYGTRGLVVSPPKAGKTTLLQQICHGIARNYPDVHIIALLIDERPEEVTDFRRNVPCLCLASSNDQDTQRHVNLAIFAIERAKRMLEAGKDVVVLLDSLTRMGRAFNASRTHASSGRTMSGGLDSRALEVPKRLFGAARKAEEGGSLTIIASCLVDTGSQADQIIFEEFKGTGNMELILDRTVSEKRIFPAMNLAASGTRKEHLLLTPKELTTITALRRSLLNMPPPMQIERLLAAMDRMPTNAQLIGE